MPLRLHSNPSKLGTRVGFRLTVLPQFEASLLIYSGRVSTVDFEGLWKEIEESKEYKSEFDDFLFLGPDADFSDVAFHMSRSEARKLVQRYPSSPEHRMKHSAFICANEIQAAMVRLFWAYVLSQGPSNVAIGCFSTFEAAADWVEGPRRRLDRALLTDLAAQMGQSWCLADSAAA